MDANFILGELLMLSNLILYVSSAGDIKFCIFPDIKDMENFKIRRSFNGNERFVYYKN